MDLNAWERRVRGRGAGRSRNEDFERTVALGVPDDGAMGETLPLYAAGQGQGVARVPRQGGDGGERYDYGYGEDPHGAQPGGGGGGYDEGGYGDDGNGGGGGRRRLSRRVLFTAAGLTLVGGGGVAAAVMRSKHSSSPVAAPSPSHTPSPRAATPTKTPQDVSSSAPDTASPPPDVSNPGSGIDPSRVQTAPEYYVHAGPKVIALTLDDGPSPIYTPQVLELLAQYRIQATFCMVGRLIAANSSLVSEVAAAGHAIVNHTWDHADQSKLSLSSVRSEIARANDALDLVGVRPTIFRAPYGAWSHAVYEACAMANLRPLDWSVDPRDWSRPGTATIVSRILHQTRTGSIILEHDGGGDRSQTVAALKIVLPKLLEAGYRFTMV